MPISRFRNDSTSNAGIWLRPAYSFSISLANKTANQDKSVRSSALAATVFLYNVHDHSSESHDLHI